MKLRIILVFAAVFLLSELETGVRADIVNYGNFDASGVDFLNVTEVASSPCVWMFGEPLIVDNALVFLSTETEGSSLTSSNGGLDFSSGALSLILEADEGMLINEVRIRHFGSMSTFGNESFARIDSSGFASVGTEVFAGSFSAESSVNQFGDQFDGSYSILFPEAERVVLSVQDQLIAFADGAAGFAFVGTQGVIIEAFSVNAIPEPVSGAGMALLIGCCFARRRILA